MTCQPLSADVMPAAAAAENNIARLTYGSQARAGARSCAIAGNVALLLLLLLLLPPLLLLLLLLLLRRQHSL